MACEGKQVSVDRPAEENGSLQVELLELQQNPPKFLRNLEFYTLESQTPAAAGDGTISGGTVNAVVLACYICGPEDSPFQHYMYPINLTIPPTFPNHPPQIRFACVITHSQISDTGLVPSNLLYNSDNLNWDGLPAKSKNIRTVLRAVVGILQKPLVEQFPDHTDVEIYHDFMHEAKGICIHQHTDQHSPDTIASVVSKLREHFPEDVQKRWHGAAAYFSRVINAQLAYVSLRKNPALFNANGGWQPTWFHPDFVRALADPTAKLMRDILVKEAEGVFSFPFLSPVYCQILLEEVDNFEAQPHLWKSRPNSMNNYGLILNEIGLETMMDQLMYQYVQPVAALLYPADGGETLDSHHTFVVQYNYTKSGDLDLDMHTDDSEVTLNVCLTMEHHFCGGTLDFCGYLGKENHRKHQLEFQHRQGRAVIHLGNHRHGAQKITWGHRSNLIMW
eukprot:CAMPEP_0175137334 /NCGR_PEP_ID=MMETSP0087-20121206/9757_1 /TAXON_ID=136419 /ORGANISM="Unknown Unknown, Strain D1" /LENGTH=447 /DNA_ID=CAMNT_0016420157 /DNA_START=15 /DNA_END=1355 /DNA_ORIENTATION=+